MRDKFYVFLVIVLGVGFCWGLAGWTGMSCFEKITACETEAAKLQKQNEKLRALEEEHPNLEQYQMEVEADAAKMTKLLPDEMENASLLAAVKKAADKSGMEVKELSPSEISEEDDLAQIVMDVHLQGDYFMLVDFMRNLQQDGRLLQIASMDLLQKGNVLECRLGIKAFAEHA